MVTLSQWLEYIEGEIGFVLPTNQHHWLRSAIQTTANSLNLTSDQLWVDVQLDETLKHRLFDAILILESRFFRHRPSIEFITQQAVIWQEHQQTQHIKKQTADQRNDKFRIWSIGCSEGQEVWSLAMSLSEAKVSDYSILGTDISTKAIHSATQAIYSARSLAEIPDHLKKYAQQLTSQGLEKDDTVKKDFNNNHLRNLMGLKNHPLQQQGNWQIDQELRSKVSFALSNIFVNDQILSSAHFITPKNVIICQNMLIYFRQFDQRDILSRLVDQCEIGGHIVLAPGEALSWNHPKMERVAIEQINAWRKIIN